MRILLGALLVFAFVSALIPLLDRASRIEDLSVHLAAVPRSFDPAGGPRMLAGRLGPERLRQRVTAEVDGHPAVLKIGPDGRFALPFRPRGPGIHFARWQVTYGRSWIRSTGLAYLEGPFARPDPTRCNARLVVAQELLDDGEPELGTDVATAFREPMLNQMNTWLEGAGQPRAEALEVALDVVEGGVRLRGDVGFGPYGSFAVTTRVDFEPTGHRLGLRVSDDVRFEPDPVFNAHLLRLGAAQGEAEAGRRFSEGGADLGRKLDRFFGRKRSGGAAERTGKWLGGILGKAEPVREAGRREGARLAPLYAEAMIENVVEAHVIPGLDAALRLPDPWVLGLESAPLEGSFRYCGPVVAEPERSLAVGFHVALAQPGRPRRGLPGAIELGGTLPAVGSAAGSNLALVVSPNLLNQALYALWDQGEMERWLARSAAREQLDADLAGLGLRAAGIRFELPPVLQRSALDPQRELALRGAFHGTLLPLERGRPAREVEVALEASLEGFQGGSVSASSLGAKPRQILLTCTERHADGGVTFHPCLSDALEVIRQKTAGLFFSLKLVESHLHGMLGRLELGGKTASLRASIPHLTVGGVAGDPPAFVVRGRLEVGRKALTGGG